MKKVITYLLTFAIFMAIGLLINTAVVAFVWNVCICSVFTATVLSFKQCFVIAIVLCVICSCFKSSKKE